MVLIARSNSRRLSNREVKAWVGGGGGKLDGVKGGKVGHVLKKGRFPKRCITRAEL